jgi:hypothetical protein
VVVCATLTIIVKIFYCQPLINRFHLGPIKSRLFVALFVSF